MFYRFLQLLCFALVLASCGSQDKANTIISGTAPSYANGRLYILRLGAAKKVLVDSAKVDSSGNFTFRLVLNSPDFFEITNSKSALGVTVIAAPKDQIELQLAKNAPWSACTVKGASSTNMLRTLNDSLANFKAKIAHINSVFDTLRYSYRHDSLRKAVKASYFSSIEEYKNFLRHFVTENAGNIASIAALYQKKDTASFFLSEKQDVKYYLLVDSVLHRKYPESFIVKSFHTQMEIVRYQLNNQKLNKESVAEGAIAPEFVLKSLNGDSIVLSRMKGRYVLLQFWASWAKPSVIQNSYLGEVYKKYKPYGFEIVQVSLDRNADEWAKAITPEMRQWRHASEFKMWNSSIVKEYNIANIPANFLINRQGVVVAKNVLNKHLYDTLRWYLVRPYLMKRDSTSLQGTN